MPAAPKGAPPQVLVIPGVVLTTANGSDPRPVDALPKVSAKLVPVAGTKAVFVNVTVKRVSAPCSTDPGTSASVDVGVGAAVAVKLAVAARDVPRLDVIASLLLKIRPVDVATTSTCTVQVPPAATLAPESPHEVAPPVAVSVPPVHVVLAFGVAATSSSDASVSAKLINVAGTSAEALLMVAVIVTGSPSSAVAAPKARVTVGAGAAVTAKPAVAAVDAPCEDVSALVLLLGEPTTAEVTSTETVQDPLAGAVPPV